MAAADYSLCRNLGCALRPGCQRSVPSTGRWQTYTTFTPGTDGTCAGWRPMAREAAEPRPVDAQQLDLWGRK